MKRITGLLRGEDILINMTSNNVCRRTTKCKSATSALFLVLLSGTMPVMATDCNINAFSAYSQAAKKGWSFACRWSRVDSKPVFLPLVPDEIGCVGRVPGWPNGKWGDVSASFFLHRSLSVGDAGDRIRKLNNGWSLIDYDVIGGQYNRYYDEKNVLIKFRSPSMKPGVGYKYVVKNLKLRKDGGSCYKAIEEAFLTLLTKWLTFLGHTKDSLRNINLFRCESILLNSHWVLVVMDQSTRRIIGFGVHAGDVDGIALCRMFNMTLSSRGIPNDHSSDNDPIFLYHQWQANLRTLGADEIKAIQFTPVPQHADDGTG